MTPPEPASMPPAEVTVVVPTYNQADFLAEALRSVIAQDFTNWRMVVVNNHSTDHTRSVVESFGDSRIEIVDFSNHGIIAASRNLAIQAANSRFIAFLDSDDWWHPTKLSRCLPELESGFDVVCHAEEWRSHSSSRVVRYGPQSHASYRNLLLGGNRLSTSAVVGRTEVFKSVGGFSVDRRFVTAEDYDLWLRLAQNGSRFAFIDDVLGVFRIHSASASSAIERNVQAEMAVVDHHLRRASFVTSSIRRKRLARSHYSAGRAYHTAGSLDVALRWLLLSMRLNPFFPRVYPALLLTIAALGGRSIGWNRRTDA